MEGRESRYWSLCRHTEPVLQIFRFLKRSKKCVLFCFVLRHELYRLVKNDLLVLLVLRTASILVAREATFDSGHAMNREELSSLAPFYLSKQSGSVFAVVFSLRRLMPFWIYKDIAALWRTCHYWSSFVNWNSIYSIEEYHNDQLPTLMFLVVEIRKSTKMVYWGLKA